MCTDVVPVLPSMGSTGSVESLTTKTRRVLLSSPCSVRKTHKTVFPCFYDYGFLVNLDTLVRVEDLCVERCRSISLRSTLSIDRMIIEDDINNPRVFKHQNIFGKKHLMCKARVFRWDQQVVVVPSALHGTATTADEFEIAIRAIGDNCANAIDREIAACRD